ncbi:MULTISPECIES: PH domain-containing protein [Acutalibacteraceae]|uniref:PH domain-containing protein n=1 Tax=Acutalibacteraceae TaxID=3082771 RepID=UPI0013E8DD35|nr:MULTISPECIES: PH domain-containing protein [Acutalibacteraceae]
MYLPAIITTAVLFSLIAGALYVTNFAPIRFQIKNGTGLISAPLYSCSFPLDSISGIQVLPSVPAGIRTNGLSMGRMAGHFVLEGIGPCQVYACAKNQPVLLIRCYAGTILLGGQTPEETERWRLELMSI